MLQGTMGSTISFSQPDKTAFLTLRSTYTQGVDNSVQSKIRNTLVRNTGVAKTACFDSQINESRLEQSFD